MQSATNASARSRSEGQSRQYWPWLLAAGPAAVVVASLLTLWLAIRSNDGLVAADYYKLGLTINRRLASTPPARDPGARLTIAERGEVTVRIDAPVPPEHLRLTIRRPAQRDGTQALELRPTGDGMWVGAMHDVSPGRRIVALESNDWRFPISVVERLPADLRLGGSP